MATSTVRSADGTSIVVDAIGEGPALVLVMGAFCDRTAPKSLAELLATDFTVYAYDRRGKGDSGDTAPYALQREVEDLAAVLAAAGGSPGVFGHSSGAALALRAAAAGLPMARLAAYEAPFFVPGSRPVHADLGDRIGELVHADRRSDAVKLFMTDGVLESTANVEAAAQSPWWGGLAALAHTLPYDLACCGDSLVPVDLLSTITVPTLVLGGGASPDWFQTSVRAVAAAIPDARAELLPGQNHGADDSVLAPVLVNFFRPVPVARPA